MYTLHYRARSIKEGQFRFANLAPHFRGNFHFHFLINWVLLKFLFWTLTMILAIFAFWNGEREKILVQYLGHSLHNFLLLLFWGFYWMSNKCLLSNIFCNFKNPIDPLTCCALYTLYLLYNDTTVHAEEVQNTHLTLPFLKHGNNDKTLGW